jgi:hypothetical protein
MVLPSSLTVPMKRLPVVRAGVRFVAVCRRRRRTLFPGEGERRLATSGLQLPLLQAAPCQ